MGKLRAPEIGLSIGIYVNGSMYGISVQHLSDTFESAKDRNPSIYSISNNKVVWSDGTILQYNGTDVLPTDNIVEGGTYTTRANTPTYKFKHWKKSNVVVNRTLVGEKYYYFKPYTILGLYTITTTLTNCTGASANATKIQENGDLTLTFTANSGYELPTGVSVTNVTSYNWNKSTGVLAISKPTGDVAIEIVAVSALPQLSTPTNVAVSDTTLTFDEVANATSYEVFVDNVSIGTHTIASGETWLLNETLTLQPLTVTIAFTSNNQRFNSIVITNIELKYDNTAIYAKFRPNWQNGEEYRTITFATPPTGEFLTWLQANAVKQ